MDRALPARRSPRFRRAAPGPPLRRAPRGAGQRRQHPKRRGRHHHRAQLHRMIALRAPEADDSEDPPETVTPRPPTRLFRRAHRQPPPGRRRSLLRLRWRRSNARPKPRTRRQHPVVVHLVGPRRRHQRHQPPCRATPPGLHVPTAAMGIASAQTSSSRLSSSAVVPSAHARFSAILTRPSGI